MENSTSKLGFVESVNIGTVKLSQSLLLLKASRFLSLSLHRYTQWHNYVGQMLQGEASVLQNRPKMHWYYEDYDNATNPRNENNLPVDEFLNYLHQTRVGPIKEFRTPMPIYRKTHFSNEERRLIWILIHSLATSLTWALLGRYYQDHRTEDQA